jgi:hypothetical protein
MLRVPKIAAITCNARTSNISISSLIDAADLNIAQSEPAGARLRSSPLKRFLLYLLTTRAPRDFTVLKTVGSEWRIFGGDILSFYV